MPFSYPMTVGLAVVCLSAQLGGIGLEEPSEFTLNRSHSRAIGDIPQSSDNNNPGLQPIRDPQGWKNFKWGMTKDQVRGLGAKPFRDDQGEKRFGLPDVEILPGKHFWVDLSFYSHIQLASILINAKHSGSCAKDEYESILRLLKKKYGKEKETKNLEYPNARASSHIWVIGSTKIMLFHNCSKPNLPPSITQSYQTNIRYEKRMFIEYWNR